MASQGIEASIGGLTREELVTKLKEVRSLIAKDAEKMKEQENTIRQQQEVLANVRQELVDIKKQMLVEGARLTEQQFRDTVKKYLVDIRASLQS